MNEVEVKARITNPEALKHAIEQLGIKLGEALTQKDVVYINDDWEVVKLNDDRIILRIREQGEKIIFTLKQHGKNELDSAEREVEVSNVDQIRDIVAFLGFHELVSVNKIRRKAKYQDIEICIDEVEGLGTYIEAERLTTEEDTEAVQEELFRFLGTLGIKREDRETRGYDTLIRLKNEGRL